MFKYLLTTMVFLAVMSALGCGSAPANNSASNTSKNVNANTNAAPVNAVPANTPLEPVASPATPPANVAGIPSNAVNAQKGAATTSGPAKVAKPGVTPAPGTPSQAEILRMMAQPPSNANTPTMKGGDVLMMKSNKPLGGKPH